MEPVRIRWVFGLPSYQHVYNDLQTYKDYSGSYEYQQVESGINSLFIILIVSLVLNVAIIVL